MRPNAGLIQALRVPFALNLQALRALLAQNQLRLSAMVDMEARHDLAPAAARFGRRRTQRPAGAVLLLLGLVAAGGLAVMAAAGERRRRGGHARPAGAAGGGGRLPHLGPALGLPAPERARRRSRDGEDRRRRPRQRAQDRQPAGRRALSQSRPAAPHRQARRPARDARGAVRRRAGFGAGLLPAQSRGRAGRSPRRGVLRSLPSRRRTRRPLAAGRRAALPHAPRAPAWRDSG